MALWVVILKQRKRSSSSSACQSYKALCWICVLQTQCSWIVICKDCHKKTSRHLVLIGQQHYELNAFSLALIFAHLLSLTEICPLVFSNSPTCLQSINCFCIHIMGWHTCAQGNASHGAHIHTCKPQIKPTHSFLSHGCGAHCHIPLKCINWNA